MKFKYVADSANQIFEEVRDGEKVYCAMIECFRTGVFEHQWYGKLNIDKKYLDTMVKNWKNNVFPTQVSFDRDHNPASGAMAWVPTPEEDPKALTVVKKKYVDPKGKERDCHVLMAKVELTDEGYSLVKSKKYKYFSSEINPNYKSYEVFYEMEKDQVKEEERIEYGPVLISGGLTNRPYIVNLKPISLSFSADLSTDTAPEAPYNIAAHGSSDELMLFSTSFACKKKKDNEKMEDDMEEDEEEDTEEDDSEDSVEIEIEVKDEEDETETEEDPKIKKNKKQKHSTLSEYEILDNCQGSVSATEAVNSQNQNSTEFGMKLSEILSTMAAKPNTADQISVLEQYSATCSPDDKIVLDSLLASKRDLAIKEKEAQILEQKRKAKEDEAASLQEKVVQLSIVAEQNKQLAYTQRIEVFCNDLDKEGHYPSVINEVKQILCSIEAPQRDHKFNCLFSDKTVELDAFLLVKRVLDTIPEDARFKQEGEQFSASSTGATTSTEAKQSETKPEPDKYDKCFEKYSTELGVSSADELRKDGYWSSKIADDGELDLGAKYTPTKSAD